MLAIGNILIFVVILSIIVVVHELGHLIAAKKFNVYCHEFSIGMGPAIFKHKKENAETTFAIRAFPLGGFVAMAGEEGNDYDVPYERTINGIKPWQQIVVMAAGAFMNLVLALIVFVGIVMYQGAVSVPSDPIIGEVLANSPAATVGIQANDEIVKMTLPDGTEVVPESFDDLIAGMSKYEGGQVIYTINRNGETFDFKLEPVYDEATGRYLAGFSALSKVKEIKWYEAFYYGPKMMLEMTVQIVVSFGTLLTGQGLDQVSGPVGIYQQTSEVASMGLASLILWLGLLSLNIGIFNLFPLPILDGGRIVIVMIETITGKKMSEKIQTFVMMLGLILILGIFLFATVNDIGKLLGF